MAKALGLLSAVLVAVALVAPARADEQSDFAAAFNAQVKADAATFAADLAARQVVTYYSATWCPPCHKVAPMVHAWAGDHPDVKLVTVDYDSVQGMSGSFCC
jgi:thiol-disulfide isomerase/thioredoxin